MVLGLLVATGVFLTSTSASAENNCGTWKAGKFKNSSSKQILVKGDTTSGTIRTSSVGPGQTAASLGICDADTFIPNHRYWVVGQVFSAGTPYRIHAFTDECFDWTTVPLRCDP
jgi:hypothetical protein